MKAVPAAAEFGRSQLLAFAGEHMHLVSIYADQGATYAAIGDTAGLEYTTRKLVAYVKAVIRTVRELRSTNDDFEQRDLTV